MKCRYFNLLSLLLILSTLTYAQVDSTSDVIFERVEVEARYPGGDQAWRQYLQKNLKAETPINNNAPLGQYTVWVQFMVSLDGSLSEIKAISNHGYGMEAEVLRIIRQSGKWTPAIQNGRPVKAYRKQPVIFMVMDESFEIKTKTPYILYTNTDNEIYVDADKVSNENIQLIVPQGKVMRGTDGKFIVRLTKPGRLVIDIYNIKKDKKIGAASFEVLAPGESPSRFPPSLK